MTAPIPVGYGSVAAYFQCAGMTRQMVITCGIRNTVGLSAVNVNTAWKTALTGTGRPFEPANFSTDYSIVKFYALINVAGVLQSDTATLPVVGTATIPTPAPNTSIVVSKQTSFAGRQYRGRMLFPPCQMDESDVSPQGIISTPVLSLLNTQCVSMFNYMTAQQIPMYLIHDVPKGGGAPPPPTIVSTFEMQPLVGTSRHRLKR